MRGVTEGTRRKYALGLATWLGFLDLVSCCWADATADHVDTFKFWRMSDEESQGCGNTVRSGLVAISAFYEWAESRYHVGNPVGGSRFASVRTSHHGRCVSRRASGRDATAT